MSRLRTVGALCAALSLAVLSTACSDGPLLVAPEAAQFDGGLYGSGGGRVPPDSTQQPTLAPTDAATACTPGDDGGLYGSGGGACKEAQ